MRKLTIALLMMIAFTTGAIGQTLTSGDNYKEYTIKAEAIASSSAKTFIFDKVGGASSMTLRLTPSSGTITSFQLKNVAPSGVLISTYTGVVGTPFISIEGSSVKITVTNNAFVPITISGSFIFKYNEIIAGSASSGSLPVTPIEVTVGNVVIIPLTTASTWVSGTIGTGSKAFRIKSPLDLSCGATGGTSNVFSIDASGMWQYFGATSTTLYFYSKSGTGNIEVQGL